MAGRGAHMHPYPHVYAWYDHVYGRGSSIHVRMCSRHALLSRSQYHFLGMELSPAFYPSALSRDELIVFYSLRGLPVADIRQLLVDVHGHVIRLVYTYTAIHNVDEVSPYNFFCLYSNRHLIRMRTALNVGKRSQRESEIVAAVQVIISSLPVACYAK